MLTWKAVKWYLRGLFPPVTTVILFLFMFTVEYFSLDSIKDQGPAQFVTIIEYIFLPIYGVLIASHIMRDSKTTVFELSVFNGPIRVYWTRVFIVLVGLLPGIVGISLLSWFKGYGNFAVPVFLKLFVYTSFAASIASVLDSLAGSMTFFILTSAVPMALRVLLQTNGGTEGIMAVLACLFAPLTCVEFRKSIMLSQSTGYVVILITSVVLTLVGYALFVRKEYSP